MEGIREFVEASAPQARPSCDGANGHQHIVDTMLKVVAEHPLMLRAVRYLGLAVHALERRGQQIGVVLEKIDVVLRKTTELPRVYLQYAERPVWPVLTTKVHVDRALDPVLGQKHRNLKSGF